MLEPASTGSGVIHRAACPNCGASVKTGARNCSFCGSLIPDIITNDELRKACRIFIKSLNKTLNNIFPAKLIIIFVVGVIAVPIAVYLYLETSGWGIWGRWGESILLAFTGLMVVGGMLGVEQKRTFHKKLKPRIDAFLRDNGLSPTEFLGIARTQVKENDPILEYLDEIVF